MLTVTEDVVLLTELVLPSSKEELPPEDRAEEAPLLCSPLEEFSELDVLATEAEDPALLSSPLEDALPADDPPPEALDEPSSDATDEDAPALEETSDEAVLDATDDAVLDATEEFTTLLTVDEAVLEFTELA